MKSFLLTFDIEEFDFVKSDRLEISYEGLNNLLNLLKNKKIKATFFVTATFCKKYTNLVKEISKNNEIASHGYSHEDNYFSMDDSKFLEALTKSKQILEESTGKKVIGFRSPRLSKVNYKILKQAGFEYDSSFHPTYIPGRYNNFFKTRRVFTKEDIKVIPISVTPLLRLPFSWFWFRNFGLTYTKICTKLNLLDKDYVNIYFHPWEFVDLNKYKLNKSIKRNTGNKLIKMLDNYIDWNLNNNLKFVTVKEYLKF